MKDVKLIIQMARALDSFYTRLGIDPNLIKKIYRPISFGKTDDLGEYDCYDDLIILKDYTLQFIDDSLKNSGENLKEVQQKLVKNIAKTIVHETIHASRTIIAGPNVLDEQYINLANISYAIGEEIIDTNKAHRINAYSAINNDSKENFIRQTFHDERMFNQKSYEYLDQIQKQKALDECVTEALAEMVINSYFTKASFDDLVAQTMRNSKREDALMGAKIIRRMGLPGVKWFMTTRFNPKYEDLFSKTFDDYDQVLQDAEKAYFRYLDNLEANTNQSFETSKKRSTI